MPAVPAEALSVTTLAEPGTPAVWSEPGAWCTDPYDPRCNSRNFDYEGWKAGLNPLLLTDPDGRKVLTELDPFLFAWVYLRKHLKDAFGQITFADPHFDWVRHARRWVNPNRTLRGERDAYVAPRSCGKTTFWFLLLPMWGAAHRHIRFAAAFADSGTQAELHLATFKRELSDNDLLRRDYPDLCEPARRHNGKTINDSQQMLYTRSGFAFAARGIDSTSLGLKVDQVRPDLLVFDDVEPDESNYSEYQMRRRLSTIQDAVLPLNEFARVALVGTVTMPGSIVHQLVRWNQSLQRDETDVEIETDGSAVNEHPPWITDERFRVHHYHAIVRTVDGGVRSVWEAKWPIEYLLSICHTRSYKKNYANDPAGVEGGYWQDDDFVYGDLDGVVSELISVDPAVTTSKRADWTGIAVMGVQPSQIEVTTTGRRRRTMPSVVVYEAIEVRKTGKALREHLLGIIARRPRVRAVLIETNQGGENWRDILHDLPVRLVTVHQTVKKEVRAANLLNEYQAHRVRHWRKLQRCQEQMLAFPYVVNDDLVDAVGAGVEQLLKAAMSVRSGTSYQR
jgi:phage terminase large subunit-like protein